MCTLQNSQLNNEMKWENMIYLRVLVSPTLAHIDSHIYRATRVPHVNSRILKFPVHKGKGRRTHWSGIL